MNNQRFKKYWLHYLHEVVPTDIPIEQKVESKRAFYAGGLAVLYLFVINTANKPGLKPEDIDSFFRDLSNEFGMTLDSLFNEIFSYVSQN